MRIFVRNNILHQCRHLDITAILEPCGDTSVIEIAHTQLLIIHQQGHQLMYILSNQVAFWVNHETLITQEWRRDIHSHFLALEPTLHLVIAPAGLLVHRGKTLHNTSDFFWQLVESWQTTLVFLLHHGTLVGTHGTLAQPECKQRHTQ